MYGRLIRSMFKRNRYKEQHSYSCPSFHGRLYETCKKSILCRSIQTIIEYFSFVFLRYTSMQAKIYEIWIFKQGICKERTNWHGHTLKTMIIHPVDISDFSTTVESWLIITLMFPDIGLLKETIFLWIFNDLSLFISQ